MGKGGREKKFLQKNNNIYNTRIVKQYKAIYNVFMD